MQYWQKRVDLHTKCDVSSMIIDSVKLYIMHFTLATTWFILSTLVHNHATTALFKTSEPTVTHTLYKNVANLILVTKKINKNIRYIHFTNK